LANFRDYLKSKHVYREFSDGKIYLTFSPRLHRGSLVPNELTIHKQLKRANSGPIKIIPERVVQVLVRIRECLIQLALGCVRGQSRAPTQGIKPSCTSGMVSKWTRRRSKLTDGSFTCPSFKPKVFIVIAKVRLKITESFIGLK